jgi:hypothetical protein
MKKLVTIREDQKIYIALPVPKGSIEHKLNVFNLSEAYISYQSCHNSFALTPYRVELNAEIIGLASSISMPFKEMLMRNNILLKDWITNLPTTAKTYDELLILEIPQE